MTTVHKLPLPDFASVRSGERIMRLDELCNIDDLPSIIVTVPTWSAGGKSALVKLRALDFAADMAVTSRAKQDAAMADLLTVRHGMVEPALTDEHIDTVLKRRNRIVIAELASIIRLLGKLSWDDVDKLSAQIAAKQTTDTAEEEQPRRGRKPVDYGDAT